MKGKAALMAVAFLALSGCATDHSPTVIARDYNSSTLAAPQECWRLLLKMPDGQLKPICVTVNKWKKAKIGGHWHG